MSSWDVSIGRESDTITIVNDCRLLWAKVTLVSITVTHIMIPTGGKIVTWKISTGRGQITKKVGKSERILWASAFSWGIK